MSTYRYLLASSLCLYGCATNAEDCIPTATQTQAIKFGPDAQMLNVEEFRPYLLSLRSLVDGEEAHECTCTRIATGMALTAKHCVNHADIDKLRLSPNDLLRTDNGCAPVTTEFDAVPVAQVVEHPDLDAALLLFDDPPFAASVRLGTQLPSISAEVILIGYGLNQEGKVGQLAAIAGELLNAEDLLTVQARGGGACVGDSGGPLLKMAASRETPTVLGVLSVGSANCMSNDFYVPVTKLEAWISEQIQSSR